MFLNNSEKVRYVQIRAESSMHMTTSFLATLLSCSDFSLSSLS